MKKVALMTWFHYFNYGTSLQVTASVHTIKKLGYQVDVINYIPHAKLVTLKNYKGFNFYYDLIKKKVKNRKERTIIDQEREKAFEKFLVENINLTEKCQTASDLFLLNDKYDAFVCGSDQIWAPNIFNDKYFLSFVENPKKMIAYAPSIGLSKIEDPYIKKQMSENISRFEYLSVREAQGAKIIKEICNKEARVVLDPTMLLSACEWDKLAIGENESKPYILCYFLGTNKDNWSHVYRLSEKINIPFKIIPVFTSDYGRGYEVVNGVGPGEFINLVRNASMICTDSFHGTVFSIIYNKPFYAYERFSSDDDYSQNSRIYNILELLGLQDRLVTNTKILPSDPIICDYTNVNEKLEIEREKSINYLKNALNEATEDKTAIDFKITNTCCGCGVCSIICPTNAIEIKRNGNGFLQSFINQDMCIGCNKCKNVCPFSYNKSIDIDKDKHNLYMLKSLDKRILNTSASGGAGYEISRVLSLEGYDIVGCIYDREKQEAVHKLVKAGDIDSLEVFQGSKYLQSNTKEAFNEVYNNTQKAVIFGTPCQIAGIDLLLKSRNKRKDYFLVDLICHGVPSQNLWNKYLKEGSKRYRYGKTPDVKFRDKSKGWRDIFIKIEGKNKSYVRNENKDLFYRFFLLGLVNMESCYECRFRTSSSADIRIGDYWGPRYLDDKEGVSMVIAMTEAGENLLDKLKTDNRIKLDKNECIEYWTVQYPQNPIKSVFFDELLEDLKDEKKSLAEIAGYYCSGFELYNKIYKSYSVIRSIIKKGRSKNE